MEPGTFIKKANKMRNKIKGDIKDEEKKEVTFYFGRYHKIFKINNQQQK